MASHPVTAALHPPLPPFRSQHQQGDYSPAAVTLFTPYTATNYQALTPELSPPGVGVGVGVEGSVGTVVGGGQIHTLGHTVTALPANRYTGRGGAERGNTHRLH